MQGLGAAEALGMSRLLERVGTCVLPGRLHDLGPYPGLVLGPGGRVRGELHAVLSPRVIAVLDDFEGFDPAHPERSLFVRERVSLLEPDEDAWVYAYNGSVSGRPRVASGDWRRHLQQRSG